ncbi:MAG: Tfx family DNA-binding protein [Methanolinea sp.]|nr:Tfx family DNA-binding protein [Methanolinea sp.]
MKEGQLSERQKVVLRLRRQGLTQQQIADIIHTSKANVCTIEKSALENIRKAKETLDFFYSLDSIHLCTIAPGTDLLEVAPLIYRHAEERGIKVKYDTISLINKVRDTLPQRVRARFIKDAIDVYIDDEGELYFS